jgi:thiamine biosynthesis lipoprotein
MDPKYLTRQSLRIPALLLSLAFLHCSHAPKVVTHRWFGMDTDFSAALYSRGKIPEDSVFALLGKETQRLELVFSDFMPNSNLRQLKGRVGDTMVTHPEIMEVFHGAEEMSAASGGNFDITLHTLKLAWGLASGDTGKVPDEATISRVMRGNPAFHAVPGTNPTDHPPFHLLGGNRVVLLRDSVVFDLGGIAKGYTVDRMHAILDSLGFVDHIVSAGGDMRLGGRKPSGEAWNVGIRHPRHSDSLAGNLMLKDPGAVSTSGDYERFFMKDGIRYHHIFNPFTGDPARPYCSVTVLSARGQLSDCLTKPLFILGPEKSMDLLRRFHAEALWIKDSSGSADAGGLCYVASAGMTGKLTVQGIPPCRPNAH